MCLLKLKQSLLLINLAFLIYQAPLLGALLNGTAAVVGKTLLTVQDVYLYRSILRFKEGESPAVLKETDDLLKKTVQKLIFEEMVFNELKSFQYEGVSKSDAEKLASQNRAKHPQDWKAIQSTFQISEKELTDRLMRALLVEKFLQKKVDTLTPVITDSEIQAYYKQNESKFKGNNFEELKPSIVVLLKKQKMQKGLEDWIKFLKEKYAVVNHLDTF